MADEWIKMRGALTEHPKVIAVARSLASSQNFCDWLIPVDDQSLSAYMLSTDALRCVTCALLMRVWSRAREHGKFVGDDLILVHSTIDDLDQMAGAPGVGAALEKVGWATPKNGVTLVNFKEYNVPKTDAERQRDYRLRKRDSALQNGGAMSRTRERVEESIKKERNTKKETNGKAFRKPTIEEVQAYCLERKNGIDPGQFIDFYESKGWKVGKTPMKDWKAAVRTWERSNKPPSLASKNTTAEEDAAWTP